MKVKELNNKLAHVCWSPNKIYPSYIACGTAAEQLDSSFSTNSTLELLKLDLSNPSVDLEVTGILTAEARFSKLLWGNYSSENNHNILIGGCENSKIYLYDYEKILNRNLNSSSECLIQTLDKHTGSVAALDLNPFQSNLLASGAGSSDIHIWDLNNPSVPMTPGAKIQPLDDINCVSWNRQVQHILASTCSGKCVVWDLRKNESIIKVSDNMSKMKAKLVAWHPEIATQMCLSSDDDHSPYLQMWDLRFATSPVRVLEGHQRGILAFEWCSIDSNFLISSGKDNRLLCWNPNNATTNGEILYELPTSGQWCFDVSWCQRNPDLICASSFEGQINVYSLMGGKYNVIQQTSSKIMDSFGVDSNIIPSTPPAIQQITQTIPQLKLAPKWMKRPCGASFAFGGKLVTFGKQMTDVQHAEMLAAGQNNQNLNQRITINQVTTDSALVEKSQHLESTLQTGNLVEYCNYKIETAQNEKDLSVWKFISTSFYQNKNEKTLELLGFEKEDLQSKLNQNLPKIHDNNLINGNESSPSSTQGAPLDSQFDLALNLNNASSVFDQIQLNSFNSESIRSNSPIELKFDNDIDSLISESLLVGRYEAVVDLCIKENRYTEAILIASAFDKNLLAKTTQKYFKNNKNNFSKLLEKVLNKDWSTLISTCDLKNWKEAMATIITYTSGEEFLTLCDSLGTRLEANGSESSLLSACICYICSFNLENLVSCWLKMEKSENETNDSLSLQNLIEIVMALRFSAKNYHPDLVKPHESTQSPSKLNSKLVEYAKLLADQGCFLNAYNYIKDSNDSTIQIIKDRLYNVLDPTVIQHYKLKKPEYPFKSNFQQTAPKTNINVNNVTSPSNVNRKPSYQTGYQNQNILNRDQFGMTTNNHINAPPSFNHPVPNTAFVYPNLQTTPTSNITNRTIQPSPVPIQPVTQQPSQPTNFFTPAPQQPQQQQSQQTVMPSYMNTRAQNAWNDPPIVAPKIKPATVVNPSEMPTFFQPSMPSTMPSTIPSMHPSMMYPGQNQLNTYQNQNMQPPAVQQNFSNQMFQPQQQQLTQQPVVSQLPLTQQQLAPQQQVSQPPAPQTPVVEKGPIPAEYQSIKIVFDTLLSKSLAATTQPTIKRKLEDVGKKLEILYDKLRDSSLSTGVVQGIHMIIQSLQMLDYQSSLNCHSQLVATSNFSEISGFMPGIKVLIQSCQQLNISYQ